MTIKSVICEPGKKARITEVENNLESLQAIVDGLIQTYYPHNNPVTFIVNEEGKINGSEPCRAVYNDDGEMIDIIFGTFLIVGDDPESDHFTGISDEMAEKYLEMFGLPEKFFKIDGLNMINKYNPDREER